MVTNWLNGYMYNLEWILQLYEFHWMIVDKLDSSNNRSVCVQWTTIEPMGR